MFLTVCLNPTIQRTLRFAEVRQGEVNRASEYWIDASGKGVNVSRVLVQLGQPVVHLTQAGADPDGERFLHLAARDGVTVAAVPTEAEVRTCVTLLDTEKGSTTEIVEEGRAVERSTEEAVRVRYRELLEDAETVIISGSKASGFSPELFPWMVMQAGRGERQVILDYREADLLASLEYGPDVIKPNLSEFVRTFFPGHEAREGEENEGLLERVRATMLELYRERGITTVLTRGRYDTLYVREGVVASEPPPDIERVNTTGSGDAFTAGFAAAWRTERDVTRAVRKGHECACKNAELPRPGVIR